MNLKPDQAESLINLGLVLQEQGQLREAVDTLRRALLLKPNFAEGHFNLGLALQKLAALEAEKLPRLVQAAESFSRSNPVAARLR